MNIPIPENKDYIKFGIYSATLSNMKTIRVDFEQKKIIYEAWINVNDQNKLPVPNKNAIATGPFDIDESGNMNINSINQECFVRRASYDARKHAYVLQIVVDFKLIKVKVDIEVKVDIDTSVRGDFIEFD